VNDFSIIPVANSSESQLELLRGVPDLCSLREVGLGKRTALDGAEAVELLPRAAAAAH
jgi:hypothetical protein